MVRTFPLLAACVGAVAAQTAAPTPAVSNPAYTFQTVSTIQARVQSDAATWNDEYKKFGLKMKQHTETFPLQYQAGMDTVNTASVEGSLYYVQTEGINKADSQACMRKTNMSYIWFMNITVVQPLFGVAQYQDDGGVVPEFGKFVAMDKGKCTPLDAKGLLSSECLSYTGLQYNANLGPWIGGEARKKHPKADYADNYWFSYPNSCFTKDFDQKDDKCREVQKGGLCPLGVQPDGIKCTYSYDVLGYIRIDDLVGITAQKNAAGQNYRDRVAFCLDNKVEYDFSNDKSDLDSKFWDKPLDPEANANRTQQMIKFYNNLLQNPVGDQVHMKPFPDVTKLSESNPPCWKNSVRCATATHGCRRRLMAQICEVCGSPAADCKKPGPNDVGAPKLNKQFVPPLPTDPVSKKETVTRSPSGGGAAALDAAANDAANGQTKTSGASAVSTWVAVAVALVAAAI